MTALNGMENYIINRVDKEREGTEEAIRKLQQNHADTFESERMKEPSLPGAPDTEIIDKNNKDSSDEAEKSLEDANSKKMLLEMIKQGCWLGEKAEITGLSGYDAKKTAGMAILEIPVETEGKIKILRLILDVTTNTSKQNIHREIEKSFDEKGNIILHEVKYFQSKIDKKFKGKLENIPRVLIGIDPDNMKRLCLDLMGASNDLGKNPLQLVLLAEVDFLLKDFLGQTEKKKGQYNEASQILSKLSEAIDDLRKTKMKAINGKYPKNSYKNNVDKVLAGMLDEKIVYAA